MVLEEENAKLTVAAVSQLTFGGKGWGWEKTWKMACPEFVQRDIGRIVRISK